MLTHTSALRFLRSYSLQLTMLATTSSQADSLLTATLDGQTRVIPIRTGQTVLEAAEAAGLEPPYSCRDGQCATCMCTLTAGSVAMDQNAVLTEADLAAGWVLACQARATTPELAVRWPD